MLSNKQLDSALDDYFIHECLNLAKKAKKLEEVPIGALVVFEDQIIAQGYNLKETEHDCTLHAEIIAIKNACLKQAAWRLNACTLYSSLEPCLMCAATLSQCRIARVVYAAKDPKAGALGSVFSIHTETKLNHRFVVDQISNTNLINESSLLLKNFFSLKRASSKK